MKPAPSSPPSSLRFSETAASFGLQPQTKNRWCRLRLCCCSGRPHADALRCAPRLAAVVLATWAILGSAACQRRVVQAAPPVIVTDVPAETPSAPPAVTPAETKPESAGPAVPPATPPPKPAPKPAPHKPASDSAAPANDKPEPTPPPAPTIAPEISPGDQASLEKKTNDNVAAAEKNLQRAYGRALNTSQHDLVEKINGFLLQSREAARDNDWVRASNLAEKARLLSVELANSL